MPPSWTSANNAGPLTSTRAPHGRPTLHLESERPRGTGGSNPSASAALTSRNTDLARSPRCRPCWRGLSLGLSWHPQQSCPSRSNEAFGTPLPSCTLRVGGYVHRGVHREDFLYASSRRRLTAPRGAVSDAAASTRAGRAASGRSPRGCYYGSPPAGAPLSFAGFARRARVRFWARDRLPLSLRLHAPWPTKSSSGSRHNRSPLVTKS